MLTCPHCKRSLTEAELPKQVCPHCGQTVFGGQATLEIGTSQLTLELPAQPAQRDSTVTAGAQATVSDSRLLKTIDSTSLPAAAADSRYSQTMDSASLSSTGGNPGLSKTLESTDAPAQGDPRISHTLPQDSGSGSHGGVDRTIDSIASPGQRGSDGAQAHGRTTPGAAPSSQDDVERRLRQVWGSQMASSRPHMTMRGSGEGGTEGEENTTLIIRERALREASSAAPMTLADYDLLNVLGEGGMGVVYNARQASIDREVAVKMLKPDMSASPAQRRKFLSEAAVTGELDHPNIVPIYDLGQNAEGALFYSMKKVTGTPWSAVIREKSLLDNLTILMKVADAVAFAHARGVVHRDLKPENVMLGDFGEVLVLDWGLAVATAGHRPTPNVSAAFNIAGTPAYMAPELAFGPLEAIGRQSDVYLLGAILYEGITGRPPHAGKNARECLKAAARNEIVPTEKRGELVDVALQAMATEPVMRYASVQHFQAAIRDYQAHSESIALSERAEEGLRQAAESHDYQDYSRALFAFEEAVQLWPENDTAQAGVSRARLDYATCALGKSDYDLGLSLIDAHDSTHDGVTQQLREAKAERDARQQRLKRARRIMAGLAAAVFLTVSVGVVVASYLAYLAKESEGRAVASALIATQNEEQARVSEAKAVAKEEQARISEAKAIANEGIATREADRARRAEQEAQQRREEAIAAAYNALIAMAAARIDENAFDQAREALVQCDEKHRGWEWRRLMHVVEQGDVTQIALPARAEALAVSPRGNLVATGSLDGIVRLWDPTRRVMVGERSLGEDSARVTALAFHPHDDRWLVAGLSEGTRPLVAWNRESGELRAPTDEHRHAAGVVQTAFAADGMSLLSASHDRTARLWDWNTFVPRTFAGHTGTVWSAALSADGQKVATASEDGTVRLWDAATGGQLRSAAGQRIPFAQHQGPVFSVVFLPNPGLAAIGPNDSLPGAPAAEATYFLASAGYDKRVLLWQTDRLLPFDFQGLVSDRVVAEPPYQELKGHSAAIRALALSPDGSRLASAAEDHTLRVWQTQDSGLVRRGALLKELRGHAGPVYAAAFATSGANLVFSSGYDDRVRMWRIDQYQEQQALPGLALHGHASAVLSARFSPAGESIVTASLDRTARRWNAETGAAERTFREGHAYLASRVIFFPRSRKLLTAGGDGTVRIWDLDKQAELRVFERTGYRAAAAVAPDERSILTGSSDILAQSAHPHGAILWNADTGERLRTLVGPHKAPVTCVAFSPAAARSLALTGDDNGVFQLWHPATGEPVGPRIDLHGSPLIAAEFAADGLSLVTADAGGKVVRWNVADSANLVRVHDYPHPARVQSIALTADGHLLTGGADGRLRLFESDGREPLWVADSLAAQAGTFVSAPAPVAETIRAVAIGYDAVKGVAVAVAIDALQRSASAAAGGDTEEEYARLFELDFARESFREISPAIAGSGNSSFVNLRERGTVGWSAAISPDAAQIATVGRDEARLFGRDGNELASFRPHQDLTFAEFSHAGDLVVTASLDSSVRVWDAASGQARLTLDQHSAGPLGGHAKPVNCAVFSSDDKHVFTGSEDGTVRQWELANMRVVRVIPVDDRGVTRLVISKNGEQLFTASRSGQAAIWRIADSAQPLNRLIGHTGEIIDLCLSRDERWIVTASTDNTARLWDAVNGAPLLTLAGHVSEVTAVAIFADLPGLRVLTGSNDRTAKLWAISGVDGPAEDSVAATPKPQAKEILSLKSHSRGLTSVAFSPDGRAALTAARDGLTILWPAWNSP